MSRWDFDVIRSGQVENWRWRKTDWDLSEIASTREFASFSSCLADAAEHGYDNGAIAVINTTEAYTRESSAS